MRLEDLLPLVRRPSRYLGTEINAVRKDWSEVRLRAALIFPDLYEIGMSHLGLHILYHVLNGLPWALADRAYCPDTDMERILRRETAALQGLESRRPLKDFDLLAITLPYELCYVNILTVLDLAGIPLWSEERQDRCWPLILGGGSGSVNAEPVADVFDAILVGDGEEAVVEIAELVSEWREGGGAKQEILEALARVEGVYVPAFYRPCYGDDGSFRSLDPVGPAAGVVRRRILPDLGRAPFPDRPLLPFMQIVHDRLGVEIARGCTRGCRFCQAGMIYRPVRERAPGEILSMVQKGLRATGWEELSLLSLSTGDYGCLLPLLGTLVDRYEEQHVAVSLPSLRVGTLTPDIMSQIRRVRKTGFTLAPEAGSERLRRVINKGITEQDLLDAAGQAYAIGWAGIKLYFMIGLPTETRDDVVAIAELARRVAAQGSRSSKRGPRVTASIGTFVPKPHTPFQWERQLTVEESRERLELIRSHLRGCAVQLKWHDPQLSFLEGVFSRGDRRLGRLLQAAWRHGARLDAWSDHAQPDLYRKAALEENLDLGRYLAARESGSPLAWGHIATGVHPEFLTQERENAWKEAFTPDCRRGKCQACGVCDFKTLEPIVFAAGDCSIERATPAAPKKDDSLPVARYRLVFGKLGDARFFGHLEIVHAFHRAARRAGVPVAHSQGFHPMPRFSFGPPVPLGTESLAEPAEIRLTEYMDPQRLVELLNSELPGGIDVSSLEPAGPGSTLEPGPLTTYLVCLPDIGSDRADEHLEGFREAEAWPLTVIRKGKEAVMDLKRHVDSLALASVLDCDEGSASLRQWLVAAEERAEGRENHLLKLVLRADPGAKPKPSEVIGAVFGLSEEDVRGLRILKVDG
jgi:radical SAM family uncharacterized protein/radical SAM-linked protein